LCGPIAVALINGELTTGTDGCSKSFAVGSHTIDILVNGYYTGSTTGIVSVSTPVGSFVTGGGYLVIGTSGGTYAADVGSQAHFGLNVKYVGSQSNKVKGQANIRFSAGGKSYEIKSTGFTMAL
jgi:hypothetical protein